MIHLLSVVLLIALSASSVVSGKNWNHQTCENQCYDHIEGCRAVGTEWHVIECMNQCVDEEHCDTKYPCCFPDIY